MTPGGGYILDSTALMLHDIGTENVKAAADYIMEHGVYSQASPSSYVKTKIQPRSIPQGKRPPNTVRPWEEEKINYKNLTGDIDLVESKWKENDANAYNYLWTTVLW
jgi:hypothetical protein